MKVKNLSWKMLGLCLLVVSAGLLMLSSTLRVAANISEKLAPVVSDASASCLFS